MMKLRAITAIVALLVVAVMASWLLMHLAGQTPRDARVDPAEVHVDIPSTPDFNGTETVEIAQSDPVVTPELSQQEREPVGIPAQKRDSSIHSDPAAPVQFAEGHASKSLRNRDFPQTYISAIHVSLTSPHHWVELTWTGPEADRMETGPFRSSPGAGLGYNNCDDQAESNRSGSNCTPKGQFAVQGYSDYLPSYPHCQFVTWFNIPREVAFHSHWDVPRYPASHGCVRLDRHAAQLIHNNSLVENTKVTVDGTWSRR
jgi:hypothetical protein